LLKIATKLKISLFGFRKSTKLGMDLQSSCANCGTDIQVWRCSHVPEHNRFLTLKLKVVEVLLVPLSLETTLRVLREMATMCFRSNQRILLMEKDSKYMDIDNKRA